MPLNPTAQDKSGIVLANFDGTADAENYPSGNKPEGDVPAAITGLAASSGPEQANLSWTPNGSTIKLYRRDDTAAGAFQLITDQISGSANMYADQGLVGQNDYSYKMVAYNEFGDAPDSNVASVTTDAALGDAYQLAAGQYSPSRFGLRWINPTGNETSRSAFLWSHSQFDYVRRVTVAGGSPPYYFYLGSPVAGVSFTRQAPSWNPYLFLWADLVIDHTQFGSGSKTIPLRCIDQEGTTLSLSLTVTVDDSKFVVMDEAATAGSGTGTLADPYHDFDEIYTTDALDATHADKIIVGRAGAYTIANFDAANPSLRMSENKPCGWIPYPGEAISFTNSANINLQFETGTSVDYYLGAATYNGGDSSAGNARVIQCLGDHERIVCDTPSFQNPVIGTSGTDNTSCFFTNSAGTAPSHINISIINATWNNLPDATNGVSAFDFYNVENAAVVGGQLLSSESRYALWVKSHNNNVMVAGVNAYDTDSLGMSKVLDSKNGWNLDTEPDNTDGVVIQYLGCKVWTPNDGGGAVCGDANQWWGTSYMDRHSMVAKANFEGGNSASNGTAYFSDSIVISDDVDPIHSAYVKSNNIEDAKSNAGNYLDANGDVMAGFAGHGTQGANFVAPETV